MTKRTDIFDGVYGKTQPKCNQSALIKALEAERIKFEKWITAPPYEMEVCRKPNNPDITAWPGNYQDYNVQLAWEAWAAAKGF